jgi:hypothetical protein
VNIKIIKLALVQINKFKFIINNFSGELASELIEELKKPVLKEGAVREKRRNADNGNKRIIGVNIFLNNDLKNIHKF